MRTSSARPYGNVLCFRSLRSVFRRFPSRLTLTYPPCSSIMYISNREQIQTRCKWQYFGKIRLINFGRRRPACSFCTEFFSKSCSFPVLWSFAGADFCLIAAKPQRTLDGFARILTKSRRKTARQNRVRICSRLLKFMGGYNPPDS